LPRVVRVISTQCTMRRVRRGLTAKPVPPPYTRPHH
jgi:hypothetical protein